MRAPSAGDEIVLSNSSQRISLPQAGSHLDTCLRRIRPLELHHVAAYGLRFPCADVANLAIRVVVPSGTRNWVGDRLTEFVRRSGSQRIRSGKPALASGTSGIGHHGVENVVAGCIVIPAKRLAGLAATLLHLCPWRKEN